MEMFRDLRGHESRLRRPPPAGDGAVFLAEGVRLVERTQAAGHVPKALMVNTEYTKAPPDLGCPVVHLTPHEIQSLTGFGAVRDLLAMFHRPPDPDPATVIPAAQRVLVLEGVANPCSRQVASGSSLIAHGWSSAAPIEVRSARRPSGSPDPGPISVASTPSAAALRMMVPTFDGFATPSSTSTRWAAGMTLAGSGSGGL